jgi:GntR family transcriptional regulator, arabinose operon transcriptional repressor
MKARTLAEQLRHDIADGLFPVGVRLPTERELATAHGVGINTVRRAVGELVGDGVVDRRQGSGTYVTAVPSVAGGRAPLVGMLVPSTAYFYPRVIAGAERVLSSSGANVLIASSEYRLETERAQLQRFLDGGVQGLILVPSLHLADDPQRVVDEIRALPVPVVLAERRPPAPAPDDDTTYVATDHAGGAYTALRHLSGLGHRRIGFLGRRRTGTSQAVAAGVVGALRDLGLERIDDALVRREEWTHDEIDEYAATCSRLGVTAVFCHGDEDAATLVVRARRLGLRVPDDLAVVAYDDEVAHLGDIPLTAVAPPKGEVGATAARLLLHRIEDASFPARRVELLPRLVVRASCGADRGAIASPQVAPTHAAAGRTP